MKKNFLVIYSHAFDSEGERHDFIHFVDLKDDKELLEDVIFLFHHISRFCGKTGQEVDKVFFSEDRLTNW